MENNLLLKKFSGILAFALLFSSFAFATDQENQKTVNSESESTEEESEIPAELKWQTLEWQEDDPEYVRRYEIEIQVFDNNTKEYVPLQKVLTEKNETSIKITPQLEPGAYRYKIISFDLLDLPSAESEWNPLMIYKAYKPEVKSISSNVNYSSTIYLEEFNDGIFNITGKNLFLPPVSESETSFTNYYLKKSGKLSSKVIDPEILEHSEDNKKIKIRLTTEQMDVGEYDFVAVDASSLENTINSDSHLIIKFKKAMDLNISAGYALPYIAFDNTLPEYLDSKIWPATAFAKTSFIPLKFRWGYLGISAEGSYTKIEADFDSYKIDGKLITAHGNLVYQLPIYRRMSETQRKHIMTLEAHAGAGIVYLKDFKFHFNHDIESEVLNSLNISADAGIAVQVFFTSRIFAELEANFIKAFVSDMSLGILMPSITIGWQF